MTSTETWSAETKEPRHATNTHTHHSMHLLRPFCACVLCNKRFMIISKHFLREQAQSCRTSTARSAAGLVGPPGHVCWVVEAYVMGAGESVPSHPVCEDFTGDKGYRVLDVTPGAPAAEAGLVQYLDFIVSVNGIRLVRMSYYTYVCMWCVCAWFDGWARTVLVFVLCTRSLDSTAQDTDDGTLGSRIAASCDEPLNLQVYNVMTDRCRGEWMVGGSKLLCVIADIPDRAGFRRQM